MGNTEIIHRGEIQFTSSGTGLEHSEYNINQSLWVHFIQIWVKPNQANLKPSYVTKKWSDEEKLNKLCLLIDPFENSNEHTIGIYTPLSMFASILEANHSINDAYFVQI
jgi:redox-sensitive bicupin YhaK (pirin superfamily)